MKKSQLLVRFDWAIKRLLRNKADHCVVEGLLTTILDRPIKIRSLLESESNQANAEDKYNRVDILAESSDGELMVIEVQNNREMSYFHRMIYGAAKAITDHISLGQEYGEIRKVFSINIVYFSLGKGSDYAYRGRTKFIGVHEPHEELQLTTAQQEAVKCQTPSDIFPEFYILRVGNFNSQPVTWLDQWTYFLKTTEVPENATAPGLAEAREIMRYERLSDEDRQIYEYEVKSQLIQKNCFETAVFEGHFYGHEEGFAEGHDAGRTEGLALGIDKGIEIGEERGIEKGIQQGIQQGIEQGRLEERRKLIKALSDSGMTPEMIAKTLGISEEEMDKVMG